MKVKILTKIIRAIVRKEIARIKEEMELEKSKEMFSKKETAIKLGVSERTLDRWRNSGVIWAYENGEKGKVLFPKTEIVKRLKEMGYGR